MDCVSEEGWTYRLDGRIREGENTGFQELKLVYCWI